MGLGGGEELAQSAAAIANHLRRLRPKNRQKKLLLEGKKAKQQIFLNKIELIRKRFNSETREFYA
jgi:flagellar biosynthesis/type III secretory pathway chaperone